MMIVMRTDLGMTTGKMIAQAGHGITELLLGTKTDIDWLVSGMKKVSVAVNSEQELLDIAAKAQLQSLSYAMVVDAGLTQNEPGTRTCLVIEPGSEQELKKVTGSLKLLP